MKARITIRPETNSRVTRLSLSTRFCIERNLGIAIMNMPGYQSQHDTHRNRDDPEH